MTSKTRSYLTHIPVRSHLEADILSRESTWNILSCVKNAGAAGVSAEEVVKELNLPSTTVYTTLKELTRQEFVLVLPKERKKDPKERRKRYLCEKPTWGKYRIDPVFMNAISYESINRVLAEKLKEPILEVFSSLFEEFKTKGKLKSLLPVSEESRICPMCKRNHEATEFVFAIILAALDSFLTESPEFTKLLIEKGYAK